MEVLSDLKRPTRRGIQVCSCGEINGTKAYHCKKCRKILKAKVTKEKKAHSIGLSAAVKLVGPDVDKIFSVPVQNGGLISRSFVQIFSSEVEGNWGLCYVANCPTNAQGEDDRDGVPCLHIQAALDSTGSATPLETLDAVYPNLNAPISAQQDLLDLASVPYEVVQRVNENHFVVKCLEKSDIPLGFVHCYLNNAKVKVFCDCFVQSKRKTVCEHIYACFWAILSDEKLQLDYSALLVKYLPCRKNDDEPQRKIPKEDIIEALSIPTIDVIPAPPEKELQPIASKSSAPGRALVEAGVSFSFTDWLSSVIERINQEMHFKLDGKPEPLIFHAPQKFFSCLESRMTAASGSKRLPDQVVVFVRKDAIPLGSFTKYTYKLQSLEYIKKIFHTSSNQIQCTRSFLVDEKGNYNLVEDLSKLSESERANLLQTRIKVGMLDTYGGEATPFCIEWIPDLLPMAKIGELRIKFEFCHYVGSAAQTPKMGKVAKVLIPGKQ